MRFFVMFVTAVCVLFLIKLRWPKKKNFYVTKKPCDSCWHYLIQDARFQRFASNRIYRINQQLSSKNVMYFAFCKLCRKQYVRFTATEFKVRFHNHKSSWLTTKHLWAANHFSCSNHEIHHISFVKVVLWSKIIFFLQILKSVFA